MIIPESVYYLGNLAFSGCSNLNCVTVLNPNCVFAACKNAVPSNSALCGYKNSTAQTYAQTYGRLFIEIVNYSINALGGSIRITDAGLRFGFSFDKTQLTGGENIEEYGFIYSYSETDNLTPDVGGVKKSTAENYIEYGDCTTFNLVFTDIPKSAFAQVVSVKAYVKIDGRYYYSETLKRSFREIADAVLNDNQVDQDIKNRINEILK